MLFCHICLDLPGWFFSSIFLRPPPPRPKKNHAPLFSHVCYMPRSIILLHQYLTRDIIHEKRVSYRSTYMCWSGHPQDHTIPTLEALSYFTFISLALKNKSLFSTLPLYRKFWALYIHSRLICIYHNVCISLTQRPYVNWMDSMKQNIKLVRFDVYYVCNVS
jgi:hypothetical protein